MNRNISYSVNDKNEMICFSDAEPAHKAGSTSEILYKITK